MTLGQAITTGQSTTSEQPVNSQPSRSETQYDNLESLLDRLTAHIPKTDRETGGLIAEAIEMLDHLDVLFSTSLTDGLTLAEKVGEFLGMDVGMKDGEWVSSISEDPVDVALTALEKHMNEK